MSTIDQNKVRIWRRKWYRREGKCLVQELAKKNNIAIRIETIWLTAPLFTFSSFPAFIPLKITPPSEYKSPEGFSVNIPPAAEEVTLLSWTIDSVFPQKKKTKEKTRQKLFINGREKNILENGMSKPSLVPYLNHRTNGIHIGFAFPDSGRSFEGNY